MKTAEKNTQVLPASIRRRAVIAILRAPARRGGFRCAKVAELERFSAMGGSYVIETQNVNARHYVPFSQMAQTAPAAGLKLRALREAKK